MRSSFGRTPYGKGNSRKFFWQTDGRKVPNWECLLNNRQDGLFLSVYVDDIKIAGKKQNLDPMWKIHMNDVDLGEPTSFLDHVFFGLHSTRKQNKQRYCRQFQEYV